ncbi:MAG: NPCBM/NEW2 domain-containing protein [Isosphaeraceae bacterium]
MFPRIRLLVLGVLLFGTAIGRVSGQVPDENLPSDPQLVARLTDGTRLTGHLQRIDADGTVTFRPSGDGEPLRNWKLTQVVSIDRVGDSPPSVPEGPFLLFPDGDRLRGSPVRADETKLSLATSGIGPLDVPLESALGWIITPPSEPEALEAIVRAIREELGGQEVLWLSNGDRLEGSFLGLAADNLEFRSRGGELRPPRKEVRALAFDPKLVDYPRPRGAYLECYLTDGSRLGLSDLRCARGEIDANARFGTALRIPIGSVTRLVIRSTAVEYLSERGEDAVKSTGYLGKARPYRRDASAEGRPIRLDGRPHDHGLGMPSRTLLAYKLDGSAARFQATIGLDDRAGSLGSVVFRVRLDDRELFASPPMAEGSGTIDLDLDIRRGRVLILEADFGERGDVRDLADWAEARLIRDDWAGR